MFEAAVIARVTLKSTSAEAELHYTNGDGSKVYRGLVKFTFNASEYLKGSGGAELAAYSTVAVKSEVIREVIDAEERGVLIDYNRLDWENPYRTMEDALAAAQKWEKERTKRWDKREGIVLLREESVPGATDGSKRYVLAPIHDYAIESRSKVWLPSASGGVSANSSESETRYYVEPPRGSGGGVSAASAKNGTVSVADMNVLIAKMAKWRKDAAGDEAYLKCIRASFAEQMTTNGKIDWDGTTYVRSDYQLQSGQPMNTKVNDIHPVPGRVWLDGRDKSLFSIASYSNYTKITRRPLPGGVYRFFSNYQHAKYVPCAYLPDDAKNTVEYFVTVTAPAGTLHEAFFDPVYATSTGEYKADASLGVLKPAAYRKTGDTATTTTISSIAWKAQQVKLTVGPLPLPPENHHIDFIVLDGSIKLRLDVEDATRGETVGAYSYTWGVCAQPWKAGDLLMLRIAQSPTNLTGATNDASCTTPNPKPNSKPPPVAPSTPIHPVAP